MRAETLTFETGRNLLSHEITTASNDYLNVQISIGFAALIIFFHCPRNFAIENASNTPQSIKHFPTLLRAIEVWRKSAKASLSRGKSSCSGRHLRNFRKVLTYRNCDLIRREWICETSVYTAYSSARRISERLLYPLTRPPRSFRKIPPRW